MVSMEFYSWLQQLPNGLTLWIFKESSHTERQHITLVMAHIDLYNQHLASASRPFSSIYASVNVDSKA